MAAPTFVNGVASAFNSSTTPKSATASLTISTGDVVAGAGGDENAQLGAFTWGPGTWTTQTGVGSGNTQAYAQTATISPSAGTLTPTIADASGNFFGAAWVQFSGSDGIGAAATGNNGTGSTAPSWSLTTLGDNSAILAVVVDWNANDGTSRVWRTVNSITPTAANGYERAYFRNTTNYAIYIAYWPDAGAAGAKTLGLSAPSTMRWVGAAVEIKGSAAAAAARVLVPALSRIAVHRASTF